ncbi:hypothetical protein [Nocardioides sp.]|uniref:hypothetical protein n=1 Tax=Nocardioides sp. TaxID=35761 RepID=UPI0035296B2A
MPQTTLPANVQETLTKQFYAGVGMTDLAVEAVRDYVTDMQKRVADVQDSLAKSFADFEPEAARKQAVVAVNARFEALSKDAKARRTLVESRITELQKDAVELPARVQALVAELVNDNVETAGDTYGDLVARGEKLVARIRNQQATKDLVSEAKVTVAKAKTTKTQAEKAASSAKSSAKATATRAKKKAAPAKSSAKATATAAKKTASRAAKAVADAAEKVGD